MIVFLNKLSYSTKRNKYKDIVRTHSQLGACHIKLFQLSNSERLIIVHNLGGELRM